MTVKVEDYLLDWIKDKTRDVETAILLGNNMEALRRLDVLLTQLEIITTPNTNKEATRHDESNPD